MKFLIVALAMVVVFLAVLALLLSEQGKTTAKRQHEDQEQVSNGCGIERWNVKTLKDAESRQINYKPKLTSVSALNELSRPSSLSTRQGAEFQRYTVSGTLVKFKGEDDGDIHAVIQSGGSSLIAELPNVRCTFGSYKRYLMYLARTNFQRIFGSPSDRWRYVNRPVTISGVAFFDFPHGQSGHADNYIELHPVLGVK